MASSTRLFSSVARLGAFSSRSLVSRPFHSTARNLVVKNITSTKEFKDLVAGSEKAILVDCFAEWCGPCKAISPILEKLSDEAVFKDTVEFVKFDVDQLKDLAQELQIRAMPTFLLFNEGKKTGEVVGANPPALVKLIEPYAKE